MENIQVIFIAATGHSGSTLLETIIGAAEGCIGMGEIFQLVDHRNKIIDHLEGQKCSCGTAVEACAFWGETVEAVRAAGQIDEGEKYRMIFERFSSKFGSSQILIDSSKVPEALELLSTLDFVELKVIHLVRDFRAWLVSMQNSYRRNGVKSLSDNISKRGVKGIVKYLQRSPFYDAYYWSRTNSRIQQVIDENNLCAILVSYEDLCFDTQSVYDVISQFIGREMPAMGSPGFSNENHNVFGNRMRFESEKLNKIRYDKRWFFRNEWVLPYFLYPGVASLNKKLSVESIKKG